LDGRYELDDIVGHDGMTEVYGAHDIRLDRVVAVKILHEDLARDASFQARFRREAQSVASLDHPSIVAVYDTGEDIATGIPVPYIVLEYVDGRTLRDFLRDYHRLRPVRTLEITEGVLAALDYSHQSGIVHRDIKPGNVMVTRTGDVKVMNFSVTRAPSDDTPTDGVIGTAQYLSPEQARGERVDARSDLYSTGCLMYELLTGRPPFTGDSPVAIAYQHVRENPAPPSRLNPQLPPWADAIVLKAMAKAPADRYQSAAEMRIDIQRVLFGIPLRNRTRTDHPRVLDGRYELDDIVGHGGMTEVYGAHDIRLDRVVAVKILHEDLARDASFQARFRREAQSAASLDHPSIVAVYDTGEDMADGNPVPYIVMEYVDGRTVRDLLQADRRLLPEGALEIIDGMLGALDCSHQSGIVHRDIKPGNVMVTRNGDIKVMDFGTARGLSSDTGTAEVIGTAQYLSPEQARGERVDARSDLYSTGCLMYELLTGRPPFTGDSPVAIAYQHVREDPVPPSVVDPEIPPWADAIVLKAMAKAPADRYQSAAEMRMDIQRAMNGMAVAAPSQSGEARPVPWLSRLQRRRK
jgi:serine/threonine protein kinase